MDRFIVNRQAPATTLSIFLKSNMDRFIEMRLADIIEVDKF